METDAPTNIFIDEQQPKKKENNYRSQKLGSIDILCFAYIIYTFRHIVQAELNNVLNIWI